MSGLKGNVNDLRKLQKRLKGAPIELANKVAAKTAPELTRRVQADFASGRTVYGDARKKGVNGDVLTLVKSGRTRDYLYFKRIGTIVRARLGTDHARFLIGKYSILPQGGMPISWSLAMSKIVAVERVTL